MKRSAALLLIAAALLATAAQGCNDTDAPACDPSISTC